MFDILKESRAQQDYSVKIRRHLHENPEPTAYEFSTIKLIVSELDSMGVENVNIPDGGVLGFIKGEKPGKTVLLRADCDALPMQESPDNAKGKKVVVSKRDGVAHTCGHDSHVAMLLSAAKVLSAHKSEIEGTVILMFERGEEGGGNIYYIMQYIEQNKVKIDSVYSLHSDTSLPAGKIGVLLKNGQAGNLTFKVELTGKGGHGSRPDMSNNPIDCFIAISEAVKDIRMRYIDPYAPLTYSYGAVNSGTISNVIPQTLEFTGTCRFYDAQAGQVFKEKFVQAIESNAALYGCTVSYPQLTGPTLPVINYTPCSELALKLIDDACGGGTCVIREPSMGSESFSIMTSYYPGCMTRVGMGNEEKGMSFGGHHPGLDLDEDGMMYGVATYVAYAIGYLKSGLDTSGFTPIKGDIHEVYAFMCRPVPEHIDEKHM